MTHCRVPLQRAQRNPYVLSPGGLCRGLIVIVLYWQLTEKSLDLVSI
jgi:hypothetical protein